MEQKITDTTNLIQPQIIEHLQESGSWFYILIGVIFSYLGYALYLWYSVLSRDKYDPRTPIKFEWEFYKKDNKREILKTLATLPFVIIFYPEIFDLITKYLTKYLKDEVVVIFNGYNNLTIFTSFAVGLLGIPIVKFLKKRISKNKNQNDNEPKKSGL